MFFFFDNPTVHAFDPINLENVSSPTDIVHQNKLEECNNISGWFMI